MAHPQGEARLAYRPEVDGLRAISVAAVMLFHAHLGLVPGGYVGVDVFFVISGYLITRIILRESTADWQWLGQFYMRRIRRILPALTVVLAASTIASLFAVDSMATRAFGKSLAAATTFLANLYFWHVSGGYFAFPADKMPLLHLWSLAIEEQFYLLFPVLAALLVRNRARLLIWALVAGITASLTLSEAMAATRPNLNFFLIATRCWELAAGALAAELTRLFGDRLGVGQRSATLLAAAGLVAIIVPMFTYDNTTRFPGLSAVPVVGGAALVILFAERNAVARMLALPPLVGLGLISFSAYLWHQPMLAWARVFALNELTAWASIALLVLSCMVAALTWRFVEQPFRDRRRVSSRAALALLLPAQLMLFCSGLLLWWSDGVPQRLTERQQALIALPSRYLASQQLPCQLTPEQSLASACRIGARHAPVTVAIIGDSHAVAISPVFARALAERGEQGILLATAGCIPTLEAKVDPVRSACLEFSRAATRRVIEDLQISTVIVAARWTIGLESTRFDNGEGGVENGPRPGWAAVTDRAQIPSGIRKLPSALLAAGKRVILVYPVPEAGWDVPQYLAKRGSDASLPPATTSAARYAERNRGAYGVLDALGTHPRLTRLYPAQGLCHDGRCLLEANGHSLYFDDNHLTKEGAYLALPKVGAALGSQRFNATPRTLSPDARSTVADPFR